MKATKHYENNMIIVYVTYDNNANTVMLFDNDTEMRRLGQCLIDLARIGGNTVEIKDKEEKEK